ncbi:hypothetical protein [Thermoanaerobacterium sp. DL9XJH110]|uniref:hypothetical protein n=1 Tax=Thermoanaerobacterium sp. DL9XJH110 TaxID=3386643 RepID=UPI003BB4E105
MSIMPIRWDDSSPTVQEIVDNEIRRYKKWLAEHGEIKDDRKRYIIDGCFTIETLANDAREAKQKAMKILEDAHISGSIITVAEMEEEQHGYQRQN